MSTSRRATYHHGDTRRQTLETARAMLADKPAHDLSLREVARRAGLSHAAPYRHFPDRGDFLVALAARCLAEFVQGQRAAAAPHDEPGAALLAAGAAYVGYGVAHPHAFALIFDPAVSPPGSPPQELAPLIAEHTGLLADLVDRAQRAGRLRVQGLPDALAAALWSLVHGVAVLVNAGRLPVDATPGVLAAMVTEPPPERGAP